MILRFPQNPQHVSQCNTTNGHQLHSQLIQIQIGSGASSSSSQSTTCTPQRLTHTSEVISSNGSESICSLDTTASPFNISSSASSSPHVSSLSTATIATLSSELVPLGLNHHNDLNQSSTAVGAVQGYMNLPANIDSTSSKNGKGFKCQLCDREFTQKGNLKTHFMTHSGERPYECRICGKNFTQKGNLDTHIKIHTETKDHKCHFCDRGFTQRGNLKTHIRSIHTKEKPYPCGHCGKAFSQKGNMMTHYMTHDKEARFPCNICGKTFSQKGNLRTHQQRHG